EDSHSKVPRQRILGRRLFGQRLRMCFDPLVVEISCRPNVDFEGEGAQDVQRPVQKTQKARGWILDELSNDLLHPRLKCRCESRPVQVYPQAARFLDESSESFDVKGIFPECRLDVLMERAFCSKREVLRDRNPRLQQKTHQRSVFLVDVLKE